METIVCFTLNVIINSLLTFATAWFLIELLIVCLRIKSGRLSSYLRMVPILKLPLDLFLYDFSRWAFLHHVDPMACELGTRTLSAALVCPCVGFIPFRAGIALTLNNGLTFTVADMIAHYIAFDLLMGVSLICALVSCFRIVLIIVKFPQRVDENLSPCVFGLFRPRIFVPDQFRRLLTVTEYQAVIAHEQEHVKHRDPLVKVILLVIAAFFWWVPARRLLSKIEMDQEIAADSASVRSGIAPEELASAMKKTMQHLRCRALENAKAFSGNSGFKIRVRLLLSENPRVLVKTHLILAVFAACAAFFEVYLGRFWIF